MLKPQEVALCEAVQILREIEFVLDVAYRDLDGIVHLDDWPDLFATYQKAKNFLDGLK